jgi:uncharacterized protein (TIRG00374 family)
MKKKSTFIISIIIGAAIFLIFLYRVGLSSIADIFKNLSLFYFSVYFIISAVTFIPPVLRWQIILKGYGEKVPFLMLLRQTLASFPISYLTPAVRIGGEPLRAYMLKKEADIDLRKGSSSIIIDKFVELTGAVMFGAIGIILLFFTPVSFLFKIVLALIILYAFYGLFLIYYRTIADRGSFSTVFTFFRLNKIKKIENFVHVLKDIEKKLKKFFVKNKKELLMSFFYYFIYGILIIFEFKFLLLSIGLDASLVTVILSLTVLGFVNLIPVPAALGFLEAGQTSLFHALTGKGEIGFVLSLIIRIRNLFFVAIGFSLISYFSGGEIGKRLNRKRLTKE